MKEKKSCGRNCKGKIVDKEKGIYCQHLEDKMPKSTRQSLKAYYTDRIEDYWLKMWLNDKNPTLSDIVHTLHKYGLDIYEIRLVYYRAVKEMSFSKLVKKQGWLNRHSAEYHYKKALKKLRASGFKFRDET